MKSSKYNREFIIPGINRQRYQYKFVSFWSFLSLLVLLAGFGDNVYSQQNDQNSVRIDSTLSQQLQTVLDNELVSQGLTGISAAVRIPNEGTWLGVDGLSDPSNSDSIRQDMLFSIGSITKTFIAALILKLAEEDLLSPDDSLHAWLPTYRNIDSTITIRQLMNHTSGVFSYSSHPSFFDSIETDLSRFWTPEEILTRFINVPNFSPGNGWSYSNTNYLLLGMIIKEATGTEVSVELRNRFFTPLNLNSTFLDAEESITGELAHGWFDYNYDGVPDDMSVFPRTAIYSSAWTAGAIVSTAEDVAVWAEALYSGNVLTPEYLDEMLTFIPVSNFGGYGLGTVQFIYQGIEFLGHSGSIPGYSSWVIYAPEYDVTVATLINDELTQQNSPVSLQLFEVVYNFLQTVEIEADVDGLSNNFELRQNYPNPFNPVTTIEYRLGERTNVILIIYNTLGQEVRMLVNQTQSAGLKSTVWDGKDNKGRLVSSGTYIYQLQTSNVIKSGKMVLLR